MRPLRRGFTLLEVMVAVAILGLALTAILSSQVGLFATGSYAQNVTQAIGLARCRMTEIEQQLTQTNFPDIDVIDEGACCESEETGGFRCSWRIERIELPQANTSVNPAASGASPAASLGGLPAGLPTPDPASSAPSFGALGALANSSATGGGLSGLSSTLTSGGASSLAPLVMGIVYPQLKIMLEGSIRKATVRVLWRQGLATKDLEIVQWLTNPARGGLLANPVGIDSASPASSAAPATTSTTSTSGSKR